MPGRRCHAGIACGDGGHFRFVCQQAHKQCHRFHEQSVIFTCGWILVCRAKTSWILWEITREQHSWTTVLEDRPPHPSRASLKLHEVMWTWKIIKSSVKSRPTSFSTWLHTLCVASANGFCFYNQLFN